jgi:hypothetical protein
VAYLVEYIGVFLVAISIVLDYLIYKYVRMEYLESKELNNKLNKVYKTRKKRVNATQLVKAVIAQEANNEAENARS